MKGRLHTLFLIPWHIGARGDVTLNAVSLARRLRVFLAEEAEEAKAQFSGILAVEPKGKEFLTIPPKPDPRFLDRVLKVLAEEDAGLVSSGGMPCFADPGGWLVERLRGWGVPVAPNAGGSCLTTLLAMSGFDWLVDPPTRRFSFTFFEEHGPHDDFLETIGRGHEPVVVFLRVGAFPGCLEKMRGVVGERMVAVFFDMTKPRSRFPYADQVRNMTVEGWEAEAPKVRWDKVSDIALMVHPEPCGLTLVLTRRGPVRHGFFPRASADKDMSPGVLAAALRVLSPAAAGRGPVRLSGGDPLARPALVRQAVLLASELGFQGGVLLSTHGGLMNEGMRRFLSEHPEVEVAFGAPSPWAGRLPNCSLDFVLEPGQKTGETLRRMREAVASGFRSFDFLPAYFVLWKSADLAELDRSFAGLAGMVKELRRTGVPLKVKNLSGRGRFPLPHDGLCVDTDGSFYASNLVLAAGMEPYAGRLRLGRVDAFRRMPEGPDAAALEAVLRDRFTAEVLEGVRRAESSLAEFVHALR